MAQASPKLTAHADFDFLILLPHLPSQALDKSVYYDAQLYSYYFNNHRITSRDVL